MSVSDLRRRVFQIALIAIATATLSAQQTRPQPAQPAAGGATIIGVVVMAGSETPVRGATVRLTALAERFETTTDGEGHFEFRNVPGTVTNVGASKAGYVSQTILLSERGIGPIAPGTTVRIHIPMVRGAVIAGRVFDHYGDPVSSVAVSVLRLHYGQPGQPTVQLVSVGQTNDLGEYRVYGLNPGSYFVAIGIADVMRDFFAANPSSRSAPAQLPNLSAPRAIAPTFFPGTNHPAEAKQIVLSSGDQALGTDFRLTNAGTVHIAGRVVDSHGAGVDDVYVVLNVASPTGALPGGSRVTTSDSTGAFVFVGVPPGEYIAHAVALATPAGVAAREKGEASTERGQPEFASERFSALSDQTGLQVQTRPGVDVKGRITIDGVAVQPAAANNLRVLAVPAWPAGDMIRSLLTAETTVNADGSFTLKNISGHRMIQATGLPAGSFLSRVIIGGLDVTDVGLDMRQASTGVTVELTTKPAVLNVSIVAASGQPASGSIVVFSEDPQFWTRYLSRQLLFRTAAGGTARIDTLPPGRYFVATVSGADRPSWADPAFLERLRPTATPVTLVAGETRSVTIQWR